MIPSIIIEDDGETVGIPILDKDEYCWAIWKEEETKDDFLKRAGRKCYGNMWCSFSVWSLGNEYLRDIAERPTFEIYVYDIYCTKTNCEFHLICYGSLDEFDDIKNCVCIPFNRLNLLKFYKEYILPFGGAKFFHG